MCADGIISFFRIRLINSIKNVATAIGACGLLLLLSSSIGAQEFLPLQPGEAYATRFSGTVESGAATVINTTGTVGSIIDIRSPGQAPRGEHWWNEPQRHPVTAAKVGQVFGVALDDASPPNIYLTATSAFGLHRTGDNADWMDGMWGADGGPGTVYKLSASNNYQPEIFATITLDGRENTGASLGNIAYDKWNKQLFVSDLETGNIHRLRLSDGSEVGRYDHGMQGRANFLDVATGTNSSLATIAFNPTTSARINDCAFGTFTKTPSCWNFADFRRRVWGLGLRRDETSGEVRLYYAIWGSQGFGHPDWAGAGDDALNNVWSVAIAAGGEIDATAVRREFFMPTFFTSPADITRAGSSHPVTDIAFPSKGNAGLMVVAERGGVRNLGLDQQNPFATPHEARTIRFSRGETGIWREDGRYDVGYYDRKAQGHPFIRANSSGGVAFGFGYGESWEVDLTKPDQFLWITGHSLCSPEGMCFDSSANTHSDSSQVHGMQGTFTGRFDDLLPEAAFQPYPASGPATPPATPNRSAMIDMDINVTASGDGIEAELNRNDATKIGDVEIYQPRSGTAGADGQPGDVPITPPPPPPPLADGFDLGIHKAGPAECERGGLCVYTITVTNHGPSPYTGPILVQDGPDAGTLFISASAGWTCIPSEGVINCRHDPVTLNVGQSITLTLTVRLPDDIPENFTANCVQIIWPMGDDATEERVNLWVEMTLQLQGYATGPVDGVIDPVSEAAIRQYQIDHGLVETGTVTDELRASLYPGDLGVRGDLNPANDRMCIQVPIIDDLRYDLGLRKTGPAECLPGAPCFFDIIITNHGPGNFVGPLVINDIVTALIGGGGGGPIPPGSIHPVTPGWICGLVGPFLQCRRDAGLVSGASTTLRLAVDVGFVLDGMEAQIRNCANIQWGAMAEAGDSNDANDRDCALVPVQVDIPPAQLVPELGINKTAPAECSRGGNCIFTMTVRNHGPGTFEGPLHIVDTLPVASVFVRSEPAAWTCGQPSPNTIACRREDVRLAPGGADSVQVMVHIPPEYPADTYNNCSAIGWTDMAARGGLAADGNAANDRSCVPVPLARRAFDLRNEKTGPAIWDNPPDGWIDYQIVVTNIGPEAYTGPISVADTLPLMRNWRVNLPWSCVGSTCTHPSTTLAPGASVAMTVGMLPLSPASGQFENCASLNWEGMPASGDSNSGNDGPACVTTTVGLIRAVDISINTASQGGCRIGASCSVAITLRNVGPQPFVGRLGIDGSLSPVAPIQLIRNLNPGWVCNTTGSGRYQCRHNPLHLAPKATQSLRLTVAIPANFAGNQITHSVNLVWVEGKPDSNAANDKASVVIPLRKVIVPPPPPIVCRGGTVRQGACYCPRGWTRNATGRNAYRCTKPVAQVRCTGGAIRNGRCYCPKGYTRRTIGRNAYRCIKPVARVRCTGGSIKNGRCYCPNGYTRRTVSRNVYRCVKPAVRVRCSGGTVKNGRCYCPRGYTRRSIGRNAYRCTKRVIRKCAKGYVLRRGQCYPIRTKRPKRP